MKRVFVLLIFFLSMTDVVLGEAYFRPQSRKEIHLSEGDSFKGIIELWNVNDISPEMVYELEGKTFLDSFYVVKLGKPYWSKNNPEIVIIEGTFILENSLSESLKRWKLGGLEINVTIKEITTESLKDKSKEKGYLILEGKYKLEEKVNYFLYLMISIFLLLLFVVVWFLRRKKTKPLFAIDKIDWAERFSTAKSRKDFSNLFGEKLNWETRLGENLQVGNDFVEASKTYLFKKEIEDFEIEEIRLSVEPIIKELNK